MNDSAQQIRSLADAVIRNELGMNGKEPAGRIYGFSDPRLPQFAFEWHTGIEKVYRIDIPGVWCDGVFIPAESGHARGYCIAEHVMTHAMAHNYVQTFCRGYITAVAHHTQGVPIQSYIPNKIRGTDPCPIR
jgi:hypothetical protein